MALDQLHSAPSLGPGDAVVFSDRALYQTYNFHDPEALRQLAGWLARDESEDTPGVAVVVGVAGSGRDYFVRAAAWLAAENGVRVRHARLGFDGFDPDRATSLADFVDHQLRMRFAPAGGDLPESVFDRRGALLGLAGSLPASFLSAAGLSFLVAAALSMLDVQSLWRSGVPTLAGPRATPADHLRSILDFTTRSERLVLVLPADEIPQPVVQWFAHEPRRNPRLSIVLSTASVPVTMDLYGELLAQVAELRPLTPERLRERVCVRFTPNEFPDRFFSGLWKRTQGVAGQIALAMMDLDEKELITRGVGPGAAWRLVPEPDDARLVEYFASHFYDQLNQIRDRQRPIDLHLVRFVELAALCGPNAPPRLITSYMALTDAERDDLLDAVDELEDAGRPVFTSLDYRHPTIRNERGAPELVYRFTDESNRLIVIRRMMHKAREAKGLLAYLAEHIPVVTRGTAELFADLAAYLEEGSDERERYARQLRWWVDAAETQALTNLLAAQVRTGKVRSEMLWLMARRRKEWPPLRRLALLEAMQADPDGIALEILPHRYSLCANLLMQLGYYADALAACEAALECADQTDPGFRALLHSDTHLCNWILERYPEALWHAREQYRLTSAAYGLHGTQGALVASRMASSLVEVGRPEEAKVFLNEALALSAEATGDEPEFPPLMSELGVTLNQMGDLGRAIECHRKAVEAHEIRSLENGGVNWTRLTSMYNLGHSLRLTGEIEEAYELFKAAATIAFEASVLGNSAYFASLLELLVIDLTRSDWEAVLGWTAALHEVVEAEPPEIVVRLKERARGLRVLREQHLNQSLPVQVRALLDALFQNAESTPPNPTDDRGDSASS